MKTFEVATELVEKNSAKFLDYLVPIVAIFIGSVLTALIQLFSIFLLPLLESIVLLDDTTVNLFLLLNSQIIGAPIVYFGLIPLFKVKKAEYRPITTNSLRITVLLFFISFSVYSISSILFDYIFLAFDLIPQSGYTIFLLTTEHIQNPLIIALYLIPTTIGAALYEELLYRRMLIPLLEQRGMNPFSAISASSLVFALGHLTNDLVNGNLAGGIIHVWTVFILALALGIIYVLTRNILFPMIVHATANFISFVVPLLILMDFDILLIIRSYIVIAMIIIGAVIGIIAIYKYFRDSPTAWLHIIKKKSEHRIIRGFIGFVIVGSILISIPFILEFVFSIFRSKGILDFYAIVGFLIIIYSVLLIGLLYFGYKKSNNYIVKKIEREN